MNAIDTSLLFDAFGRCTAPGPVSPVHRETRRRFVFQQPAIDYPAIHARTVAHLCNGHAPATSVSEFETRAKAIHSRLLATPHLANITRGAGIPFLLPSVQIDDYGTALEEKYILAVGAAFKASLPEYDFKSHNPVHLGGLLRIAPESRHAHLVDAARRGDVVGWLYPSLLEYSLPAAREVMATLPENFLLAGGIDTCAALVGSPDLLLRLDGYPPLLWLAALDGEKREIGYHFEAYGYNLTFNRRAHLGQVAEYWASALVVLG